MTNDQYEAHIEQVEMQLFSIKQEFARLVEDTKFMESKHAADMTLEQHENVKLRETICRQSAELCGLYERLLNDFRHRDGGPSDSIV